MSDLLPEFNIDFSLVGPNFDKRCQAKIIDAERYCPNRATYKALLKCIFCNLSRVIYLCDTCDFITRAGRSECTKCCNSLIVVSRGIG